MFCKLIFIFYLVAQSATQKVSDYCSIKFDEINTEAFSKFIPTLEGKHKGEAGKIGIIGGSTEYTGAPYFAGISALKAGADLVYVITTESAAPVIKSYSPDLIVYPFLHKRFLPKISTIIPKMDLVVIGPGLGREQHTTSLIYEIINICRKLTKPLVIDADGLYAISKNKSVIDQYPSPGIILTPNHKEADYLEKELSDEQKTTSLYCYWGDYVSVLVKGKEDTFYSKVPSFEWRSQGGGSGRRAGGQGDILAGVLGTFYNWGIKANVCSNFHSVQVAQSFASIAAANLTRKCSSLAYSTYGRSMTASDMLKEIHNAFDILMKKRANIGYFNAVPPTPTASLGYLERTSVGH